MERGRSARLRERSKGSYSRVLCDASKPLAPGKRERKRKREVRGSRVPSLSPYQAETNLSWRITLAVSIYSDTRRISRERPTRPTFPPHRLCVPAIHLRCMSPDSAHTGPCENSTLWNLLKPNRRMHFVLPSSSLLLYSLRFKRSPRCIVPVCAPAVPRLLRHRFLYRWHLEIRLRIMSQSGFRFCFYWNWRPAQTLSTVWNW